MSPDAGRGGDEDAVVEEARPHGDENVQEVNSVRQVVEEEPPKERFLGVKGNSIRSRLDGQRVEGKPG